MNVEVTLEQLLTVFTVVAVGILTLVVFSAIMLLLEVQQQSDSVTEKPEPFTGPYDSEFPDGAKL